MEETQNQTSSSEEQKKSSFNPGILIAVILIVLVGGIAIFANTQKNSQQQKTVEAAKTAPTASAIEAPTGTSSAEKEFTVVGKNFSFTPNQIIVKKGDKVKITFSDEEGFHNMIIDGYNEKTQTIRQGNSAVVEFIADKAGSFPFYCGVGSHREEGMQGTLVVQ